MADDKGHGAYHDPGYSQKIKYQILLKLILSASPNVTIVNYFSS